MNPARAALLLAAAVLAGCATQPKERADATKRSALTPALERPGLQAAREIFAVHLNETLPFHPNGSRAPQMKSTGTLIRDRRWLRSMPPKRFLGLASERTVAR